MKKILLFSAFILVTSIGIAKELQTNSGDFNCQDQCSSGADKCCITKGGSVYYGKCNC